MNISLWLKNQMVSAEAYDTEKLLASFLLEMQRGLDGLPSSLAMIPAYIDVGAVLPLNRTVAVVDSGGTNLRIGLGAFDSQGHFNLSSFTKQPMPGRDREQTAAEFYAVLTDALVPLKDQFEAVGFCFSYPAEILPDYDGRLLHWTKEIRIPDMVGCRIGAGLRAALAVRGAFAKKVVVLNDTVAALLAGLAQGQVFEASSYIGFILGTGTNTAYVEQNRNIRQGTISTSGTQIINVESGGFAGMERGPVDLQFDAHSDHPGAHVFEKLISGAYLGPLALALMQAIALEGAFPSRGRAVLMSMPTLSTIHIDNLVANNGRDIGPLESDTFTDADREVMKQIFRAVIERAALLTAVNLAAAVIKNGAGREAAHPVCINIDGSTYYHTDRLAELTQRHLLQLLDRHGAHVRCICVDDAPAVGAAIAALTVF